MSINVLYVIILVITNLGNLKYISPIEYLQFDGIPKDKLNKIKHLSINWPVLKNLSHLDCFNMLSPDLKLYRDRFSQRGIRVPDELLTTCKETISFL